MIRSETPCNLSSPMIVPLRTGAAKPEADKHPFHFSSTGEQRWLLSEMKQNILIQPRVVFIKYTIQRRLVSPEATAKSQEIPVLDQTAARLIATRDLYTNQDFRPHLLNPLGKHSETRWPETIFPSVIASSHMDLERLVSSLRTSMEAGCSQLLRNLHRSTSCGLNLQKWQGDLPCRDSTSGFVYRPPIQNPGIFRGIHEHQI